MKRKLVVGNWKMNGDRARNAKLLERVAEALPGNVDVAVCVPFPYLAQAQAVASGTALAVGAQNVSEYPDGAHTGEVSCAMLSDFAVRYVIVGHSERRAQCSEGDAAVARKAFAALKSGIVPIVCIGETMQERDEGRVREVLSRQLQALAEVLEPGLLKRVVIAYEPVWAIGTGRAASPEQVQDTLALVRGWLGSVGCDAAAVRILYGGSVKADGAEMLFGLPDADGGLIGGASLEAEQFLAICSAAEAAQMNVG